MSSSSDSDISMSRISYPPPKTMKQEDYSDVNNWNRPQNAKAHCKCIIVTDTVNGTTLTDDDDNDSDSDKKGVPAFLVGTNGKLLSVKYKKQIYSSVKGFFNDNVNPKDVPSTIHQVARLFARASAISSRPNTSHSFCAPVIGRPMHFSFDNTMAG